MTRSAGWTRGVLVALLGLLLGFGVTIGTSVAPALAASTMTLSAVEEVHGHNYDASGRVSATEALSGTGRGGDGRRSGTVPREDSVVVFGVVVAAKGGDEAFHYTFNRFAAGIEKQGLRPGSYATPNGTLSPPQAHIDLALRPNRGLPDALIRVDLAGLREAGYTIPRATQVGRSFGMPGGGVEMQFPYAIPPQFLKVIPR